MKTIQITNNEIGFPLFGLNQVGKLLFGIGHHRFMSLLRKRGWIINNNTPSQQMLNKGYLVYRLKEIKKDHKTIPSPVTLVTVEGLAYLKKAILKAHIKATNTIQSK